MNTAPHLLPEDRPDFERAVDEALREADKRPALAAVGEQISAQQLRVMALSAATAIAADAAEEYEQYVALRTQLRQPAVDTASPSSRATSSSSSSHPQARDESGEPGEDGERRDGGGGLSLAGVGEGVGETTGAGLLAMVSVLVPLLAGTAAVIFLLIGNLLRVVSPEPSIAEPMRGAGWVFAILAAAGIVVAMAELWLTAVRNGAGARRNRPGDATAASGTDDDTAAESRLAREVSAARAVWRETLLERGIVPFLAEALAGYPSGGGSHGAGAGSGHEGAGAAAAPSTHEAPRAEERTPRLGYSGPDFSSRSPSDGKEHESLRPRYSSPDYSSPDYGGPEHKPE
ncbi:hypothetical protein DB35_03295 [Streptomyces abyssalis]|uniref:Transmembrane protein n=1 Tax=Streptomyces abyssalis TaxID=933944 RepID=A0A1E7JR78_9ACTN|nr:hypothetical protein AN215_12410 [Streptomyces abyssalis]OEU95386.1 hypothetical protein DB35_03295 [Streptomyces abyssalis]